MLPTSMLGRRRSGRGGELSIDYMLDSVRHVEPLLTWGTMENRSEQGIKTIWKVKANCMHSFGFPCWLAYHTA